MRNSRKKIQYQVNQVNDLEELSSLIDKLSEENWAISVQPLVINHSNTEYFVFAKKLANKKTKQIPPEPDLNTTERLKKFYGAE